jgi:hypothetical protein
LPIFVDFKYPKCGQNFLVCSEISFAQEALLKANGSICQTLKYPKGVQKLFGLLRRLFI